MITDTPDLRIVVSGILELSLAALVDGTAHNAGLHIVSHQDDYTILCPVDRLLPDTACIALAFRYRLVQALKMIRLRIYRISHYQ